MSIVGDYALVVVLAALGTVAIGIIRCVNVTICALNYELFNRFNVLHSLSGDVESPRFHLIHHYFYFFPNCEWSRYLCLHEQQ